MSDTGLTANGGVAKTLHELEFRGSGGEYFRIWIVNIALTIITLGIYGAWAKVRTLRYLRGNTYLADHPFDYHASPVRILIGRVIAVSVLIGYSVTAQIHPLVAVVWVIFFMFITPWLVVSSIRFNARNTSYRNVRFNFVGTLGEAAMAYILWPFLSVLTLFTTWPLVHRIRDYFFINNHTFGGKSFSTEFSGWAIYRIYLLVFAAVITVAAAAGAIGYFVLAPSGFLAPHSRPPGPLALAVIVILYLVFLFTMVSVQVFIHALSMNLALNRTILDGRHELRSKLGPLRMAWISFSNALLVLVTIGLFYPWARIRLTRYEISRLAVLAASDLDEFTSEAFATQGAIGEEIANFFDLGISL
jgi:uncharacterized membrane protein YjgN (DUF898 family)